MQVYYCGKSGGVDDTVLYRLTHGHHVTHTNIKFHQTSTINYSTNMALIDDALAALESLQLGEQPNFTQVAKKYSCPRLTLSKRWQGVQGLIAQKLKN
jgi:hypothetical protein